MRQALNHTLTCLHFVLVRYDLPYILFVRYTTCEYLLKVFCKDTIVT